LRTLLEAAVAFLAAIQSCSACALASFSSAGALA
jgi:hypothetical protein